MANFQQTLSEEIRRLARKETNGTIKEIKAELAQARERAQEELKRAQEEYDAKRVARVANSPLADEMTAESVSKPLTKFDGVDFVAIYDAAPAKK